jgi:putative transposase
MRTLRLNHSVFQHEYHIVFGTKRRRKFLKTYVKPEFERVMVRFQKKYPTVNLVESNLNNDHVHLLLEIPPNLSVAIVVMKIKWLTSVAFKKKFKFIKEMYLDGNIWGVGYFSSTIGINETTIKKYIKYQGNLDTLKQVALEFS